MKKGIAAILCLLMACHAVIGSVDSVLLCVKETVAVSLHFSEDNHCHSVCSEEDAPVHPCGTSDDHDPSNKTCGDCLDITLKAEKQPYHSKQRIDNKVEVTLSAIALPEPHLFSPIRIHTHVRLLSRAPPIAVSGNLARIQKTVLRL